MRHLATIIAGVLTGGLCQGGQGRDLAKEEMKNLQGTWTVVSLKVEGEESKDPKEKELVITFRGDKMLTAAGREKEPDPPRPYRLDPGRKPKHIDIDGGAGRTAKGIYALDGATLTLCLPNPFLGGGGERPTKFESDPLGLNWLMVLKRKAR